MRSTSRLKRATALIGATALVTAALAGCTAIPGFGGGCDAVYDSGDASSLVTATGAVGSKPAVDFPTPLVTRTPQVSVIDAGDGDLVPDGAQVAFTVSTRYGADGQDLSGTSTSRLLEAGLEDNAISEALVCAHVGDRLALVATTEQAYGAGAGAQGNIADEDTLVIVIDVTASYLGKADGFNQLPRDGMPTVVTAVDGTPGVSVLLQTPPDATRGSTIKSGSGVKVKDGQSVVAHVSIWTWPSTSGEQPTYVNGTWKAHQATVIIVSDPADGGTFPSGVTDALVGRPIGSQVLVVLPPGDDSYPAGQGPAADDSTYIFVIDLLGIQE